MKEQQFVRVKRYTPILGFCSFILLQVLFMIPIINVMMFLDVDRDVEKKGMWEGIFYFYDKIPVEKEKVPK